MGKVFFLLLGKGPLRQKQVGKSQNTIQGCSKIMEGIEKAPHLPAVSHKPRFIGLPSTITLAE